MGVRPRRSYEPSNAPIDANAMRRQAKAEGRDLSRVSSVVVQWTNDAGEHHATIRVRPKPHHAYGWRWFVVCPICGTERVHLYVSPYGVGCRACLGLRY